MLQEVHHINRHMGQWARNTHALTTCMKFDSATVAGSPETNYMQVTYSSPSCRPVQHDISESGSPIRGAFYSAASECRIPGEKNSYCVPSRCTTPSSAPRMPASEAALDLGRLDFGSWYYLTNLFEIAPPPVPSLSRAFTPSTRPCQASIFLPVRHTRTLTGPCPPGPHTQLLLQLGL
jgi:hypothetical protein